MLIHSRSIQFRARNFQVRYAAQIPFPWGQAYRQRLLGNARAQTGTLLPRILPGDLDHDDNDGELHLGQMFSIRDGS